MLEPKDKSYIVRNFGKGEGVIHMDKVVAPVGSRWKMFIEHATRVVFERV